MKKTRQATRNCAATQEKVVTLKKQLRLLDGAVPNEVNQDPIQDSLQYIIAELQMLGTRQQDSENKLLEKIEENRLGVQQFMEAMSQRLRAVDERVDIVKVKLELAEKRQQATANQVEHLNYRVKSMEAAQGKNQLIFLGIGNDNVDSKYTMIREQIEGILRDKLQVDSTEIVQIMQQMDCIMQLGCYKSGTDGPVLVSFTNFFTRQKVYAMQKQLVGTNLRVHKDYSLEVPEARRALSAYAKSISAERFFLRNDEMKVGEVWYIYDKTEKLMIQKML